MAAKYRNSGTDDDFKFIYYGIHDKIKSFQKVVWLSETPGHSSDIRSMLEIAIINRVARTNLLCS